MKRAKWLRLAAVVVTLIGGTRLASAAPIPMSEPCFCEEAIEAWTGAEDYCDFEPNPPYSCPVVDWCHHLYTDETGSHWQAGFHCEESQTECGYYFIEECGS